MEVDQVQHQEGANSWWRWRWSWTAVGWRLLEHLWYQQVVQEIQVFLGGIIGATTSYYRISTSTRYWWRWWRWCAGGGTPSNTNLGAGGTGGGGAGAQVCTPGTMVMELLTNTGGGGGGQVGYSTGGSQVELAVQE